MVMTEVNIIENEKGWWIDTRATHHISNDRTTFKNHEMVGARIEFVMGNSTIAKVVGKGDVEKFQKKL